MLSYQFAHHWLEMKMEDSTAMWIIFKQQKNSYSIMSLIQKLWTHQLFDLQISSILETYS